MTSFTYVCGDRGIPLPGTKGASIHVEQLCRAFTARGLHGELLTNRRLSDELAGVPLHDLDRLARPRATGPDFVYERYSLWHIGGLEFARRTAAPFVLEVNSPLPDEARRHRGLVDTAGAYRVASRLLGEADGVVCVSSEVADWVRDHRGRGDNVWVVPNGVDPVLFRPRSRRIAALAPIDAPMIAFCGSFRPWHGLRDLFEAFREVTSSTRAHLVCVGEGPEREPLETRLGLAGLGSSVTFSGAVPQASVADWIGPASVAVVPYPTDPDFYFSPLKLFEFMALGLPVVAASIGQIPEILGDGRRGLLYPPGDWGALARGIRRLLDDRSAALELAERARSWVLEHATWDRRAAEILDHISGLQPPLRVVPRSTRVDGAATP